MAGGEGARLSVLTIKRAKPAVPFGGKYRIIDFTLSNCVNSGIFDIQILAQYRPQSLIEHVGSGGPWDLARDFTGGVRILTPYKSRRESDWYEGTADAVQQNFSFIKQNQPDHVLILSGDQIYTMDYDALIAFHTDYQADLTMGVIRVSQEDASRFGVVTVDQDYRVRAFTEKPKNPTSTLINMGVYLFNRELLDRVLWEDHLREDSSHDFGKDILPELVKKKARVYAFPYSGYWMDVGTLRSYWQAHLDLLSPNPPLKLYDRSWVIHTRTEERPPVRVTDPGRIYASMLSDGCAIHGNATVESSVLSPGVTVLPGAVVRESVILTDTVIQEGAVVERAIIDKRSVVEKGARVGAGIGNPDIRLAVIGKGSVVPAGVVIEPGATVSTDVIAADYPAQVIRSGEIIQTKRQPYEI